MKILYFFCGEGLGHTTRAIAAGRELSKAHDVVFASYGYAKTFFAQTGLPIVEIPSEIKLVGKSGQLDITNSILATIQKSNPTSLLHFDTLFRKHKPDLVISDSYFLPAVIAKSKRIPVWMILNQTNVEKFFSERGVAVRWIGNAVKQINYGALHQMDKILIPDFAPPYTICAKNLWLTPQLYDKIEYLGPLGRTQLHELKKHKKNPKKILASIGGFGYRQQLLDKIQTLASELTDYQFDLIAGPNGISRRSRKNVTTHTQVFDMGPLIADASVVICGGGHSTIMESVTMGKPVISAPDAFHFEQESNAQQLEELGFGTRIDYKTPAVILQELIQDHSTNKEMKKRLDRMVRIAQKTDGRKRIAELAFEAQLKKK